MRYLLCFLLPDKLSREINLVREFFEKGVSVKIPPHISLTYPFWYEGKVEEIADKVQNLILNLNSFSASIVNVDTFDKENGGRVIYLSLDREEGFRKLHEKLNSALGTVSFDTSFFPKHKLPEQYKPHITVVMNDKESDVAWIQNKLAKIKGKEFLVDKITLLSNEKPKEGWEIKEAFNLKSIKVSKYQGIKAKYLNT